MLISLVHPTALILFSVTLKIFYQHLTAAKQVWKHCILIWNNGITEFFFFVQRVVGGFARFHLCSKVSALTYTDLKKSLISEFKQKISTAHVHDLLCSCKCSLSELPFEYFLVMKEIASHWSLDDSSLLHYVTLGINDSPHNKALLYGASNLSEFKEKL